MWKWPDLNHNPSAALNKFLPYPAVPISALGLSSCSTIISKDDLNIISNEV